MTLDIIFQKILRKIRRISQRLFRYGRYWWNRKARGIAIDGPPVFIVGCGHSGTSILLAILGAHSRIFAVPYETFIATDDHPHRFRKALKKFDRWAIADGKRRWVEKTPKHICHIDRILKWAPKAKILITIRDGRDVARSIQVREGSVEKGIQRWVADNLAGKSYWRYPNVHVVKYEDLVEDFEGTMKDILDFLNEEYEEGMREYYKTPRKWFFIDNIAKPKTPAGKHHEQYRSWQINQPLFDGRGRWKEMSSEELSIVEDIGGEMLAEFGYTMNYGKK